MCKTFHRTRVNVVAGNCPFTQCIVRILWHELDDSIYRLKTEPVWNYVVSTESLTNRLGHKCSGYPDAKNVQSINRDKYVLVQYASEECNSVQWYGRRCQ